MKAKKELVLSKREASDLYHALNVFISLSIAEKKTDMRPGLATLNIECPSGDIRLSTTNDVSIRMPVKEAKVLMSACKKVYRKKLKDLGIVIEDEEK